MRLTLPLILFAATLCFALGIVLPLIRVERLYLFTDEPSLTGIVVALWTGGDGLLAAAVALFSIVFPSLKLALLHIAMHGGTEAHARQDKRAGHGIHEAGALVLRAFGGSDRDRDGAS